VTSQRFYSTTHFRPCNNWCLCHPKRYPPHARFSSYCVQLVKAFDCGTSVNCFPPPGDTSLWVPGLQKVQGS